MKMNPTDTEIIDRLGGTTKTAALCEVSAQAVSQWRLNGIPKPQRKFLKAVRPDAFEAAPSAPTPAQPESQPQ
jgi:hypothetical protein